QGESPFCMTFAFFYRASLGGPDERREQKFATLVGDHFGMSPTNILLTLPYGQRFWKRVTLCSVKNNEGKGVGHEAVFNRVGFGWNVAQRG
ncbi:hypothetical protein, partial [Geobacillus stearothermophilus]|uniref:hypothetical protein n=1 Tax=Geobacillus stearothermophilus TaxID=1422 RepID=UPI003D1ED202